MSFEIRPALPKDSAAIEAVRIATWRVACSGVTPEAYLAGLEVLPAEFSTGMGRALMTATTEAMAAAGRAEAGLWVPGCGCRAVGAGLWVPGCGCRRATPGRGGSTSGTGSLGRSGRRCCRIRRWRRCTIG
ncbi:hypothetical protein [Nonomuraea sp. NPDC049709]|uniref:hypothetical protein n=1 Tax=Nonomuraea sp. NPDC049709 TaxID=3154736 RepID=UPI00343A7D62